MAGSLDVVKTRLPFVTSVDCKDKVTPLRLHAARSFSNFLCMNSCRETLPSSWRLRAIKWT
jgi:hypothetical protein